ncbi:flavin reductase (DIM6/NTAB) family NADH-FMN oxidoreductase RutF [Hydrogenivirga caldilitoris]|uniref:Flavin reductase (DIM6/NTAB) family NADH-FMN oxidoreductase RutF n=1 Tax=Hydrogenivirga caldilitoris TaxID=246264 RepID=A0A497XQL8_9AQUI|nr:flavin reductase family protein [Hydrogenivirga caldilitoris]RLJ71255.1 flavin reductase (DIM6/NTAB) family NADH-FMN oxidoreductase RutF [Hydrogenivirga caldilitoris]
MEFVVGKTDGDTLFRLVLGLIVPRPIGWVSTVSKEGVRNIAPFSFFNAVNDEPPVLMISVSDRDDGTPKDTVKNILDTGEFVVNMVTEDLFENMLTTSEGFPPEVDEFEMAGLTPEDSILIKAPRIKEAKVSFECRLFRHEKVYDMHLILGEVVLIKVQDGLVDEEGRVNYSFYRPIGRLGGAYYLKLHPECIIRI